MARTIRLTRMIGKAGELAYQVQSLHFSGFHPPQVWKPAINAFCFDDRIEICVDLAGVDRSEVEVTITAPNRLLIRGLRKAPEGDGGGCRRVLALEIESGRFHREIGLPCEIDEESVTAKQKNGLLCIQLPVKKGGKRFGSDE